MVVESKMELQLSKEGKAKNLLMRAWRERWTDVQWGIHVRMLTDSDECDGSLLANCILQQALGGPGPNSLVLSYLMHSIYSQIISTCAVLKSICKYDGFHKPYCVASLLDIIESMKGRNVMSESEDSMELAQSLAAITHWLLTCMYSSLEHLSDLADGDVVMDVEDSKIVLKCKELLEFFLTDKFVSSLIYCAVLENDEMFQNIKGMSGEIAKFSDGHHHEDIVYVNGLVDKIGSREECRSSGSVERLFSNLCGRESLTASSSIQTILLSMALFRPCDDVQNTVTELKILKTLKGLSNTELIAQVMHGSVVSIVDALGTPSELQIIGSSFLVLPHLMKGLLSAINASSGDLMSGLDLFLENDSVLEITDTKLGCYTLELFLTRFQRLNLVSESDRKRLLERMPQRTLPCSNVSSSAVSLLEVESTLPQVFSTLEGVSDMTKNQDSILAVLNDLVTITSEFVITAAACTKQLRELTLRLLRLNQISIQINGETGKASSTRALIFDITFLILTSIGQTYGTEAFPTEDSEFFFLDWYKECMVENTDVKDPDAMINRCDPAKVDMLFNQYLQGDSDLKTSLVVWREVCTNSVGCIRDLLLAWEAESANFVEVKKVLDVFRSKMCCLPICISTWLCSHIQLSPEEQTGKAKYVLNHFLNPLTLAVDEDHFQERLQIMNKVITKMMKCVEPFNPSTTSSPSNFAIESKPIADLYKKCFSSMRSKGVVDVETLQSLKQILQISGSHYFVQGLVNEMMEIQSTHDLLEWCDMLYGIFSLNIQECTTSLIRVVLPSLLHYSDRESHFVEPQILALISLTVDSIISCCSYHAKSEVDAEKEPSAKRRKLDDSKTEKMTLKETISELLEEFEKILRTSSDARPQTIFILKFLEQLSLKSPDPSLLNDLPNSIITNLMQFMNEDVDPKMLINWHSLKTKDSRSACVDAICKLYSLQRVNSHFCFS